MGLLGLGDASQCEGFNQEIASYRVAIADHEERIAGIKKEQAAITNQIAADIAQRNDIRATMSAYRSGMPPGPERDEALRALSFEEQGLTGRIGGLNGQFSAMQGEVEGLTQENVALTEAIRDLEAQKAQCMIDAGRPQPAGPSPGPAPGPIVEPPSKPPSRINAAMVGGLLLVAGLGAAYYYTQR